MKAIETHYAGCRFRSRLEARWAVFFDHLGIPWEYEPEGFELSIGRYLPDFRIWVPDDSYPYWFEVKPPDFRRDDRHRVLCVETATPLIVASGMPRSYLDQLRKKQSVLEAMLWGDRLDGARIPAGDARPEVCPAAFVGADWRFPGGVHGCGMWDAIHKARSFVCSTFDGVHVAIDADVEGHGHHVPMFSPSVDRAYATARSARFEYGESG